MASIPVYNQQGKEVGSYELDPADISPEVKKQLLHDAVVMYQRNKRQGTVGTKSRGMVSGTNKKMYRQKGTGNARAGGKRTNIRRGGGHAFAKKNIDFSYSMPRKAVRLATRMSFRSKVEDGQIKILDELSLAEIKTKPIVDLIKALGLNGTSVLLAVPEYDAVVYRSARNIVNVRVMPVAELNAYDLLRQRNLLVVKSALESFVSQGQAVGAGA
ncbi:MAG: 50S ribosomal protein L4 [Planctomycetaceae bacterium]|jgi:large subunit ribosomal protein L4|nr:50S ribosomal protein L4 [Planctomycetaceae bacterium]MDG2390598.1 50S ribosomal protein L4 [Planctomycetaceae bacterium]